MQPLLRRRPWLTAAMLTALAGATVGYLSEKSSYRSVVLLQLRLPSGVPLDGVGLQPDRPANYAELAASHRIAWDACNQPVWKALGDARTTQQFQSSLNAQLLPGDIIEIHFNADQPAIAQAGAEAATQSMLRFIRQEEVPDTEHRIRILTDRETHLDNTRSELHAKVLDIQQLYGFKYIPSVASTLPAEKQAEAKRHVQRLEELTRLQHEAYVERKSIHDRINVLLNSISIDARVVQPPSLPRRVDARGQHAFFGGLAGFTSILLIRLALAALRRFHSYRSRPGGFPVIVTQQSIPTYPAPPDAPLSAPPAHPSTVAHLTPSARNG